MTYHHWSNMAYNIQDEKKFWSGFSPFPALDGKEKYHPIPEASVQIERNSFSRLEDNMAEITLLRVTSLVKIYQLEN